MLELNQRSDESVVLPAGTGLDNMTARVAPHEGLEPPAVAVETRCSNPLS